ncbi:MAG: GNAT family N-acetyltransferase [Proteobacteria bacterium]|nr:GNAT family N-acetyltransferase [Pseudomonadota bacterium]
MYCRLGNTHLALIRQHLLSLSAPDRLFRFNSSLCDMAIGRYCAEIDWDRCLRMGFVADGIVRGMIQLAPPTARYSGRREAALTVDRGWRRRGIGTRLVAESAQLAASSGCRCLVFYWHPENDRFLSFLTACGGFIAQQHPPIGWLLVPSNQASRRTQTTAQGCAVADVA